MRVKSIEIWRLLFAISIVLCHAMLLPWNTDVEGNMLFHVNSLGVEFFFILSGFLMAKSVTAFPTAERECSALGSETTAFLLKKLKPIYPVFLFAACFELVVRFALRPAAVDAGDLVWNIWDLLFLRAFGLGGSAELLVGGASWYLFALFPAMWILYPLLRKYTDMFLHVIEPLTG